MKKLPSSRLNEPYRSATRFLIVGTSGTLIQYGLYWGLLMLFNSLWPEVQLTTLAFSIAYVLETFTNYLLTAWYTFASRPNWKNLGGFLSGRVLNYFIQIALLHTLLMMSLSEEVAGFLAILIAGIINYFVVKLFFKKPVKLPESNTDRQK